MSAKEIVSRVQSQEKCQPCGKHDCGIAAGFQGSRKFGVRPHCRARHKRFTKQSLTHVFIKASFMVYKIFDLRLIYFFVEGVQVT